MYPEAPSRHGASLLRFTLQFSEPPQSVPLSLAAHFETHYFIDPPQHLLKADARPNPKNGYHEPIMIGDFDP